MIVMRSAATKSGEVAEWLNALASKASVPERVSGVRISPSPPSLQVREPAVFQPETITTVTAAP
jgi:hypothetical protein